MHIEQRATIYKEWLRINLKMTNNPTEKYQQRKRAGILEKKLKPTYFSTKILLVQAIWQQGLNYLPILKMLKSSNLAILLLEIFL